MNHILIYIYPLLINMVVGIFMFVGPMRATEQNASLSLVSLMITNYGVGYIVFSLFMGKIVKPHLAKRQIIIGAGFIALLALILGFVKETLVVVIIYTIIPAGSSLFFNAFQAFMKDVQQSVARPLAQSVTSYIASLTLGFAFGPFISGWLREASSWSVSYFFAAAACMTVAILAFRFKPQPGENVQEYVDTSFRNKPDLARSGWAGAFVNIMIISLFLTIFPKQSGLMELRPYVKGMVVFLLNITQMLWVLIYARNFFWQFNHRRAPFVSLLAVGGLLLLFFAKGTLVVYCGVILLGIYASTMSFSGVFHCLTHPTRSVRNIAINEVAVGTGFLLGPQLIRLAPAAMGFTFSYIIAIVLVVALIVFQFYYIKSKTLKR